jgi:hypothetical protein
MLFDRRQPVLRPQHPGRDQGRAGIAVRAFGCDQGEVALQQRRALHSPQLFDAGPGFAGHLRLRRGKVIAPAPGMAVDHRKGRFFFRQMAEDRHQGQMLDHIGEIAGMIAVPVVHKRS